ncbi:P-loop containing nucleoside triphosphate hydrolase protein [Serendipita vermifera]|nr:P-loop containing nucleoside triphosphate hydrolase protein [Serendipita vermifera]
MAHIRHINLGNWTNQTSIMLIGDPDVGKHYVPGRYIYNQPPLGPNVKGRHNRYYAKRMFPLSSAPLLTNGQPICFYPTLSETVTRTRKGESKTIEIGFSFYISSFSESWTSPLSEDEAQVLTRSDVVIICYDCSRPETFHRAIYRWHPMVLHHNARVPIFLLGCKSDLKPKGPNETSIPFVTTEEAKKAALQIGAIDALECSAKDGESIKKVCDLLIWYSYYSHFGVKGGTLGQWERLQSFLR